MRTSIRSPRAVATAASLLLVACGTTTPVVTAVPDPVEVTKPPPRPLPTAAERCRQGEDSVCETACNEGDGTACNRWGVLRERGSDPTAAQTAYAKGCESGSGLACSNLGVLQAKGGDATAAVATFHKACGLGSASGCANLGVMTYRGDGVAKSREQGIDHLRKACGLGHTESCEQLRAWGFPQG